MSRIIITLLFFCSFILNLASQDTLYLKKNFATAQKNDSISYYQLQTTIGGLTVLKVYNLEDTQVKQESYKTYNPNNRRENVKEGFEMKWFPNGQLKSTIQYKDNKVEGPILSYWENGQLKRKDSFVNNEFIEGECFDEEGNLIDHYPYFEYPKYRGGTKAIISFISDNLKYPKKARRLHIEGRVIVAFVVNKEGELENVRVIDSVHESLDKEALRVVNKMKQWTPGKIDGEIVKIQYNLPVAFKLN